MNPMQYATNPLRDNQHSMAEMARQIFNPTPEEIVAWQKKQKANAKRMHAAIARLKKEGKW